MAGFADGLRTGARSAACGLITNGNDAQRLLDSVVPPNTDLNRAASQLRRVLCDQPPADEPPPIAPPFTGGQCPAFYNVQATGVRNGVSVTSGVSAIDGPLQGLVFSPLTTPDRFRVRYLHNNGQVSTATSLQSISGAEQAGFSLVNLGRVDGLPDDCGDPPITPPPAWPAPGVGVPTTIDYDDPGGNPQTEPGDITIFSPTVNIRNELNIPFTFAPDIGLSIDGSINVSTGDITISPRLNIPGRGAGDADGTETPPEPPASDPAPDDDPALELIRAVVVTSNIEANRRATELLYPGQPTTMAPRLGVVRFAIASPGGGAVWSGDIPIKQTRQWIDCPSPYGATDAVAAVDAGSGNTILSVVPIRGPSPWIAPDE